MAGTIKSILLVATLLWIAGGVVLIKNWKKLFGKSADHENETSGARSYGITHLIVIWLAGIWMGIYFFTKIPD